MNLKTESVNIDGHQYEITVLPPSKATAMVLRLHAAAAKPLAALLPLLASIEDATLQDAESFQKKLLDIDPTSLANAAAGFIEELRVDDVKMLFSYVVRDDKPLSNDMAYDMAYAGNWSEWRKALYHIIRVNGLLDF